MFVVLLGSLSTKRLAHRVLGLVAPNASILVCYKSGVKAPLRVAVPHLFGEKLRRIRHQNGLTQVELAHRVGLASHSHITNLETSRDTPSLDLIVRIARILGLTTDYFLRDTIPIEAASTDGPTVTGSEYTNQFGAKLRALRQRHGWGQTELARRLGLARRGYISNLEAGRKLPSLELVVQIADLFGVTTDTLLRDEAPLPAEDAI